MTDRLIDFDKNEIYEKSWMHLTINMWTSVSKNLDAFKFSDLQVNDLINSHGFPNKIN